jgi:hypothetical protein
MYLFADKWLKTLIMHNKHLFGEHKIYIRTEPFTTDCKDQQMAVSRSAIASTAAPNFSGTKD